jgi:flavorubredoxin
MKYNEKNIEKKYMEFITKPIEFSPMACEDDTEIFVDQIANIIGQNGRMIENTRKNPSFQNIAIYVPSRGKLWYGDIEKQYVHGYMETIKKFLNETVYLISGDDSTNIHSLLIV